MTGSLQAYLAPCLKGASQTSYTTLKLATWPSISLAMATSFLGGMVFVNELLHLTDRTTRDEAARSQWEEINGSALDRLAIASMAPVFKA